MEQEQAKTSHAAILHVLGQEPLSCMVSDISSTGVSIKLTDKIHAGSVQTLSRGDLAQLLFNSDGSSQAGSLKVRCAIESSNALSMRLSYIDSQEPIVRQLVNWFGQSAPSLPSNIIPSTEAGMIQQLSDTSVRQLSFLLDLYLEQCDDRLLGLAEIATNNEQQNKFFEVKLQLRQHSYKISQLFCSVVEQRLLGREATPAMQQQSRTSFHEEMELVDLEEFEDWLSLEVIIKRANARYYNSLQGLAARYSKLSGHAISEETLPIGPHSLCLSLQSAFKNYDISPTMLPVLYRFFEQVVISQLEDLYDTLNGKLKSYGILPNIDAQILQSSRSQQTAAPREPTATELPPTTAETAQQPTGNDAAAPELYAAVTDLLNLLRGTIAPQEPSPQVPAASYQDVIDALAQLQQNQTAISTIAQGETIQNWLNSNQGIQLGAESANQINLVSSIFSGINSYPHISESVANELKKLQVPVARLALTDQQFFTDNNHPAKVLLNQLIELCLQSDMPNATLEKNVSSIVSDIAMNLGADLSVFQNAATQLDTINQQHKKAQNRNSERIAQTYEGRQRVQNAEQAVKRALRRRVSPPTAPQVVIDLIDNGWRELLKLSYIKLGPENESWNKHLQTLDQLLVWVALDDGDEHALKIKAERALDADAFTDLLSQELNNVFPGDYRHLDTIEDIRATLKGEKAISYVQLDSLGTFEPSNPNQRQKELEAENPDLNRWFKRVNNFSVGDEFCYIHDESGQKNIKLAWISDDKQHFVFVNNRGQKVLDYDLVDLANELSSGLSPVESQSEWPLVERSLYSTVQQAYEQLAFKSSHDELTDLISRKECERLLSNALSDSKTSSKQYCLLYLDVDQFSLTNNLHGHVAGDQLLVDFSALLQAQIPQSAVVGRMAGNEFIVLLEDLDFQQCEAVAAKLCRAVDNYGFGWKEHIIQLTVSIGLVDIDKYTENVVDLIRNAVTACTTAKGHGGNRVHNYRQDPELHNRREKLLSWINKLNSVLNSDKLVLRGQKISPLCADDDEVHYEILLAIKDDEGKLTSPVEFIEAAEAYNRMQRVDRWVIEHSFIWLSKLQLDGRAIPSISINLSGNSINDDTFMEFILELFAQYKIPTKKICFEVTETATINNLAEAADFIREVKKIGCRFSLDDFGSGNASYQYLKHLPVDYLKIDGMFVQEMDKNKNDYALVTSINEIAHLMGKKTIAEYAETEELVRLLNEIGVDYVQGYAVSYPTPLDELQF